MKRTLIAIAAILSVSAVVALAPYSDLPPSVQMPAVSSASWLADDGWAAIIAIIVMAVIAKRNGKR